MRKCVKGKDNMTFIGLEIIQRCMNPTGETLVAPLTFPILDVDVDASFPIYPRFVEMIVGRICVADVLLD
jgi:hypothetical protein